MFLCLDASIVTAAQRRTLLAMANGVETDATSKSSKIIQKAEPKNAVFGVNYVRLE